MKSLKTLTFIFTLLVIGFTPLDALEIGEDSGVTFGRYFFIAMTACALLSKDLIPRHFPAFIKPLVLFTVWATIGILWSVDANITLTRCMLLVQYLIIVSVMCNVLNSTSRLRIGMAAWAIGACYIAYKTATDFSTNVAASDGLYRVTSFGNPNENSFMLVYGLVMCYLIDRTKSRWPSLAMTVLAVYAIIANSSRMGVILFLVAVAGLCVSLWQSKKRAYVLMLVPAIIVFGTYILANIPTASLMRIMGISDDIEAGSFAHRETIWANAFEALSENEAYYLFGSGWGTFSIVINKYCFAPMGAHNFYLDVLFTTGAVGLGIVIYYLFRLFFIIRKTRDANLMNYMLLFLPLISMMSTNWQSRRWWFMMGAFIYLIYKTDNLKDSRALNHER